MVLNRPMRVSIPGFDMQKEVLPGFEPGSPDSESEVLTSYTIRPNTPGGTRTHNLILRRDTRYPLRYGG